MPVSISTKLGDIHVGNLSIPDNVIINSVLSDSQLENAVLTVLTDAGQAWQLFIHIYDRSIPDIGICMARPGIIVDPNWWERE